MTDAQFFEEIGKIGPRIENEIRSGKHQLIKPNETFTMRIPIRLKVEVWGVTYRPYFRKAAWASFLRSNPNPTGKQRERAFREIRRNAVFMRKVRAGCLKSRKG